MANSKPPSAIDAHTVRVPIFVPNECEHCGGDGRVPGGKYKHEGEVISCPLCKGQPTKKLVSLGEFYELLFKAVNVPGRGK